MIKAGTVSMPPSRLQSAAALIFASDAAMAGQKPILDARAIPAARSHVGRPDPFGSGLAPSDWGMSRMCARMVCKNRMRNLGIGADHC